MIGGALGGVLLVAGGVLIVIGMITFVTMAPPPAMAGGAGPWPPVLWPGQILFFAGGGLVNLAIGVLAITAILASKVPPR